MVAGSTDWSTGPARGALDEAAPDAAAAFGRLAGESPAPSGVTGLVRRVCAETLGVPGLPTPEEPSAPTGADDAIAAMARQLSTDVSAVDDQLRADFQAACGAATFGTIQAIYLADFIPRVTAVWDRLAASPGGWDTSTPLEVDAGTSWASIEEFLRVVYRLDALDPVLSEVVRLYGARQHNCRLCRSIRSRPALVAGATEELFDAIDEQGWAHLPERTRVALALTDALIWHPATVADDLVDDVRRWFTPAEAAELVLDVMRNAANKIAVALGADQANVSEGTEVYEIDLDGVAHYGLAAP